MQATTHLDVFVDALSALLNKCIDDGYQLPLEVAFVTATRDGMIVQARGGNDFQPLAAPDEEICFAFPIQVLVKDVSGRAREYTLKLTDGRPTDGAHRSRAHHG